MEYNDFIKSLFGPEKIGIDEDLASEILVKAETQSYEILTRSNRSFEVILNDSVQGLMGEGGCLKSALKQAFSGGFNPKQHDKKDPDSYCWDFFVEVFHDEWNLRLQFEVKSTKTIVGDRFYFNAFSLSRGLDLTTYIKHGVDHTDFLILVSVTTVDDGFIITPMYAFNSNQFTKYIKPSDNPSYTNYVDIQGMINLGHAINLQR